MYDVCNYCYYECYEIIIIIVRKINFNYAHFLV